MATNLPLWMRVSAVNAQHQSAVHISDSVTFAASATTEPQHQVMYNLRSLFNYKRMATNLPLWMLVLAANA